MATRVVEGKKPYTGGQAIDIDENKVISLRLRDENNLIIYDEGDDEIYVDLQLDDEITPTSAFPVGVNTGRVIVDNGWDKTGTIIVAKTTSGDNIKLLYADDGTLWMDNGTGTFKQIYFKADVDLIIQAIQSQIDALSGLGKFLSLWDGETGEPISFPLAVPYDYHTGDWFMINNVDNTTNYRPDGTEYDGTASSTVETEAIEIGDVYIYDGNVWLLQKNGGGGGSAVLFSQVLGDPYSNTNLATALNAKQDTLTAGTNIQISNNVISATGGDVLVSSQANNIFTSGMKIWGGTESDYQSLTPDSNTAYLLLADQPTPPSPWQPGTNTIAYRPVDGDMKDYSGNGYDLQGSPTSYETLSSGLKVGVFEGSVNPRPGNIYPNTAPILQVAQHNTNNFTVSFWINVVTFSTETGIMYVQGTGSYQVFYWSFNTNTLRFGLGNGAGSEFAYKDFNTTNSANTWYHIVFVYDYNSGSPYVKCYKDNVLLDTISTNAFNNWNGWDCGTIMYSHYDNSCSKKISRWIIEDKARTAQEISDYFDQTKGDYGIS